jgi:hypothetical protein
MMGRRVFITMVTSGVLAAPLAAEAQRTGKVYHIGHVGLTKPSPLFRASRGRMRTLGSAEILDKP